MIPTLTMLTIHHFRGGGPDSEVVAKHPAARFMVEVWNGGDFQSAHELIAPDIEIYVNGARVQSIHGGAALVKESIDYWRAAMPDLVMHVVHECVDPGTVSIHWHISGSLTGELPGARCDGQKVELEGAVFLKLEEDRVVAAWTLFDGLSLAQQMGTAIPVSDGKPRR